MHILFLPSWYPRNPNDISGVFFRDQALALHRYGHIVGVIAPTMRSLRTLGKGRSYKTLPAYENDNGLLTYRKEMFAVLPRLPYGNYWLFKRTARELLKRYIIDNGKPDILHAHAAVFGGAAGSELAVEFDIPLALTEHSSGFARRIYSKWQLGLAKRAIDNASSCIAVSPSLAELLSKQFSDSPATWSWVPNVVADRFKEPCKAAQLRRPIRFLNLALMTENKGHFDLLLAFKEIISLGMSAELWLAGDGPIKTDLECNVKNLDIADKVRFLGMVEPDKVPELLAKVDVMVVSSHYETFGVVAAEALMSGVPVVATRCGGPECIVEEDDGLLVPPKQPKALSEAMGEVARKIKSYDPAALANRARRRFSGPAVADQLTKEYERILSDASERKL